MPKTHLSLLSLFSLLSLISSSPIDTFVYGGCSQLKYAPGTPFQSNLNSLLTSLLNSASSTSYANITISSPTQDSPLYGLYQCRGDISTVDCSKCVQNSITQLGILCLDSCGGAIQLQGCLVKYDNVTFVGMQDKTLVVKKCGLTSNGYGNDLLSRRDEVLMELGSGSGSYRVGTAGYVSGMAQCVGDLDGGECSDCVSEAVERLRTGCGLSVSGDVYLVKCYVRYSAGGVYSKETKGDSSDDEAGKTFAIIIGLLAGVALIVVFLSFLRKAFDGGKGK
ncbi:plasmodesmata-located protein 6-like [Magnolia sinica]|uniref:plasmodesmata-located protein 6-like n=1 Tax=Magnolia sinica TaxID=86752 RepID=UPI00265B0477|nr:plasmodesmata-located protein 6-like [Magnolia sinica]